MQSISERFWSKVNKDGPIVRPELGPCWLWRASVDRKGYGYFGIKDRKYKAHRMSWELAYGPPTRELFVCHRCDVPGCVRPSHLFLGTASANSADMVAKGRQARQRGEACGGAKFTERDVIAMRYARAIAGVGCRVLSSAYGVNQVTVSRILNRTQWAHV